MHGCFKTGRGSIGAWRSAKAVVLIGLLAFLACPSGADASSLSQRLTDAAAVRNFTGSGVLAVAQHDTASDEVATYAVVGANGATTPVAEAPGMEALVGDRVVIRRGRIISSAEISDARAGSGVVSPGTSRVLAVMVSYADKSARPFTAEQVDAALDGPNPSADSFYSTQTGGAVRIGATVVPSVVTASESFDPSNCADTRVIDDAVAGARAQGYDPASYDETVIVLEDSGSCRTQVSTGYTVGTTVILNTTLQTGVVAHELGHAFGANHAASLSCSAAGARVSFSENCVQSEYGDTLDGMGSVSGGRLFSTWHREEIGQLVGSSTTLSASGSVSLAAATTSGRSLVMVPHKVPGQPITQWWALELRAPTTAFDTFAASDAAVTGVTVRLVGTERTFQKTALIDMHPSTTSITDAPLMPGETFTDPSNPTTSISVGSVSVGDSASVTVTLPAHLDDTAPTTPSLTGERDGATGVSLSWSASSDDVTASPTYEISRDGVAVSTTRATSFSTTDDGASHVYSIVALDDAGNRSSASEATVPAGQMEPAADTTAPTMPSGLSARQDGPNVTLSWGASSDAVGVAGYRVIANGVEIIRTVGTSHTYAPSPGTVSYRVTAYDSAGNQSDAATTAFVVMSANTGTGTDPSAGIGPAPGGTGPSTGTSSGGTGTGGADGNAGSGANVGGSSNPPSGLGSGTVTGAGTGIGTSDSRGSGAGGTLTVDTAKPRLRVSSPRLKHGVGRLARSRKLVVRATDASRVTITARIGSKSVAGGTIRLTAAQARKSTVKVTAEDAMGNRATLRLVITRGVVRIR